MYMYEVCLIFKAFSSLFKIYEATNKGVNIVIKFNDNVMSSGYT